MLKIETPLISDFLLDNYKNLQRRNDFEDLCDDLDNLQEDLIQEVFEQAHQEGFDKGYQQALDRILELNLTIEI
ncbi:MAG: hypothetical protein KBT03_13115 [Bacteroidales bacterium]|nr:hypothetical protein [Candidatus Scybalousia scybalohippi]